LAWRHRGRRGQEQQAFVVERASQQLVVRAVEVLGIGAWWEREVVIERPLEVILRWLEVILGWLEVILRWLEGVFLRLAEPLGVEPQQELVQRERLVRWRTGSHDREGPLFVEHAQPFDERKQGVVRRQPVRLEPQEERLALVRCDLTLSR
jgi:hypothetical protein